MSVIPPADAEVPRCPECHEPLLLRDGACANCGTTIVFSSGRPQPPPVPRRRPRSFDPVLADAGTPRGRSRSPMVRAGLREFLDLGRLDVILMVGLVVFAFLLRFLSPVIINIGGSGGAPGVAVVGEHYPTSGNQGGTTTCYTALGETAEVPIPPVQSSPAHPAPSPTTSPGFNHSTIHLSNQCGFVFDELYFTVDAADYAHQPAVDFFDPEPPLTKLLMAPPEAILGFNSWSWRLSTTIFGSLLAGLIYLIAMRLRRDRFFATVAGFLIALDGLALVESRTGVIDIIAIFFSALVVYFFLLHWQARTRRQWRITLYLMACAMGLAFAAKVTALVPLALVMVLLVARFLEPWLIRHVPLMRRIWGAWSPAPQLWYEAATTFGGSPNGPARRRLTRVTGGLVQAVGLIGLVAGTVVAFGNLLMIWTAAKVAASTEDGAWMAGGLAAMLAGAVLSWCGLRIRYLVFPARVMAGVVAALCMVGGIALAIWSQPGLGAVIAGLCASLVTLVIAARERPETESRRDPWVHDVWRTALHYFLATALMLTVFTAAYGRYLTISHSTVYRFTSGCVGSEPGIPVSRIDTLQPALPPTSGVNIGLALYNVVDKFSADLKYHFEECHPHPYASRWYTWPIMEHPVLMYLQSNMANGNPVAQVAPAQQIRTTTPGGGTSTTTTQNTGIVTNMGNPAIWWLGIICMLAVAWMMLRGPNWWRLSVWLGLLISLLLTILGFWMGESNNFYDVHVHPMFFFYIGFAGMGLFGLAATASAVISRNFVPGFIVMGYELAWMMWVIGNESRVLFFYHALGMLLFMVLAVGYCLSALRRVSIRLPNPLRGGAQVVSMAPVAYAALLVIVAAFIFFYPVWTGIPIPGADQAMRSWLDLW